MNIVDIGMLVIILCSMLFCSKSGVVKSAIGLAALVVSAILAFQFKDSVANYFIDLMPFVNFAGPFENLTTINVLFYHGASFILLFVVIYSILNIVIVVAGFVDKLVNATVILAVPNKILGAVVGFIQGVMLSFVIIFVLVQMPHTQQFVIDSDYGFVLLNRTPIIKDVLAQCTVVATDIAVLITENEKETKADIDYIQKEIMSIYVKYGVLTAEYAQELIDTDKVSLPGVQFQ
ncbi:MAG: CvpA family protein [bacterium]